MGDQKRQRKTSCPGGTTIVTVLRPDPMEVRPWNPPNIPVHQPLPCNAAQRRQTSQLTGTHNHCHRAAPGHNGGSTLDTTERPRPPPLVSHAALPDLGDDAHAAGDTHPSACRASPSRATPASPQEKHSPPATKLHEHSPASSPTGLPRVGSSREESSGP